MGNFEFIKIFNQVWSISNLISSYQYSSATENINRVCPIWSKQKFTIFTLSFSDGLVRKRSQMHLASSRSSGELRVIKKSSSCSTIYIDDSTVSQPNLKNTIKVVSLAIYYNVKNRTSNQVLYIFDKKTHPLTRDWVQSDCNCYNPEHRQIYKFIRTLFNLAQLTA